MIPFRERGKVYLVGAGPGDPKLLTLRAVEVLGGADDVLKDGLVPDELLEHVRPGARIMDVSKRAGCHGISQQEVNALMVEYARRGDVVVRLKSGDPFVFGRGGEEAEALAKAGVAWEVVPGVTAGIAAAAYAGIPLLHRAVASSAAFVSGHDPEALEAAPSTDTLVIFMCASHPAKVARALVRGGRRISEPVAIVESGSRGDQVVYAGALGDLLDLDGAQARSPALMIVGEVARFARTLSWFGRAPRPLHALLEADWQGVEHYASAPAG